mgnify:CR=1 FL=1
MTFIVTLLSGAAMLEMSQALDTEHSDCGPGCAPVQYSNLPWRYKIPGELVAQPTCVLDLGTKPIPPYNLTMVLVFNHHVDDIIVSDQL